MMRYVVLVLVLGCSNHSDDHRPPPTAHAGARAPARTPAAPAPPTARIDCNALLTAEEVSAACDVELTMRVSPNEDGTSITTCNRTFWAAKNYRDRVVFHISQGMNEIAQLAADGRPLQLGDRAVVSPSKHMVQVEKGNLYMELDSRTGEKRDRQLCSDDGLVELAKRVTPRLP